MMPAEITGYIDGAVRLVQSLKPDEAILLPGGAIFARSHAGTLRFGWGWPDTNWPRTRDVLQEVSEHVTRILDPEWAGPCEVPRYRRELHFALKDGPVACANVGRRNFRFAHPRRAA